MATLGYGPPEADVGENNEERPVDVPEAGLVQLLLEEDDPKDESNHLNGEQTSLSVLLLVCTQSKNRQILEERQAVHLT